MTKHAFKTNWGKSVVIYKANGSGAKQVSKNIKAKGNQMIQKFFCFGSGF